MDGNDVFETEECDLGTRNVAFTGDAATLAGIADHSACTDKCKVTDKSKWRCTKSETSPGSGVWESSCEWLCGNRKVDIDEDEG